MKNVFDLTRFARLFSGGKKNNPLSSPDGSKDGASGADELYKNRCVLVGVVRNVRQFDAQIKKKFYHIPLDQVSGCEFPVRYVAIYQSKKQFGKDSGIRYFGEVKDCLTVPRDAIRELPKNSKEKYLYFKIKKWYRLDRTVKANEMEGAAFSTSLFLLKNARSSAELQIRSAEEHRFFLILRSTVSRLVRENTPDGEDIRYRDFTVKLKGGMLYLYFADVLDYVIGYDVFLEKPTDVIRDVFDYYPEL